MTTKKQTKAIEPTKKQIEEWKVKAEKWDKLDNKIATYYFDENGDELEDGEGNLIDIGEAAAMAFGYM